MIHAESEHLLKGEVKPSLNPLSIDINMHACNIDGFICNCMVGLFCR